MRRSIAWFVAVAWLSSVPCTQAKPTKPPKRPTRVYVVELPPDRTTRGDWEPAYGRYFYILCGMRSPRSIRGGTAYPYYKLYTGSPKEVARAWVSGRRTKDDARVLHEPWSRRRTASVWDDHGEEYPIGKGPNLMIDLRLPKGKFRLSLYFFEIDWIQYRAHNIRFWPERKVHRGKPLLSTPINNFFNGTYKRFALFGPARLTIEITREKSPNATLSGLFLDRLTFPRYEYLRGVLGSVPRVASSRARATLAKAQAGAKKALDDLVRSPNGRKELQRYLKAESVVLGALEALERGTPAYYYAHLAAHWQPLLDRVGTALAKSRLAKRSSKVYAISFQARRATHDYAACSAALGDLADALAKDVRAAKGRPEVTARLQALATGVLGDPACQDVRAAVEKYLAVASSFLSYDNAAAATAKIAREAFFANRPKLTITALETLQRTFPDRVRFNDLALLGNACWMAGEYEKGIPALEKAIKQMSPGPAQAACMLNLLSCHLGAGRVAKAMEIYDTLAARYPDDDSVAQAQYRFARAYFDQHEYQKSEAELHALLDMGPPEDLAMQARKFLDVIKYRESNTDYEH